MVPALVDLCHDCIQDHPLLRCQVVVPRLDDLSQLLLVVGHFSPDQVVFLLILQHPVRCGETKLIQGPVGRVQCLVLKVNETPVGNDMVDNCCRVCLSCLNERNMSVRV